MTCQSNFCGRDDPAIAWVACYTSVGTLAFSKPMCRFHAKAWELIAQDSSVTVRIYRRIAK